MARHHQVDLTLVVEIKKTVVVLARNRKEAAQAAAQREEQINVEGWKVQAQKVLKSEAR